MKLILRQFLSAPAFSATAILTLALGIGATTAIFSVVHGVVLKPLPYPESERIVVVGETDGTTDVPVGGSVSPVNFMDWVRETTSFSHLAAHRGTAFALTGRGEPMRVPGRRVGAAYFGAYGVQPALGRDFRPDDDRPGDARVAILSHALWQQQFGGRPEIIGESVVLEGEPHTIIGVMPESFTVGPRTDIWTPIAFTATELEAARRGAHYLNAIARLKPGVSVAQAREELGAVAARLRQQFPDTNRNAHITVLPLLDFLVGSTKPILLALLGAVAALLLIACANVANLLLARATVRQREVSVRAALGASRLQLVRQLLAESLVLAGAGGALGIMLASWGIDALLSLAPAGLPRAQEIGINGPVLGFTLLLTGLTGVVFGLAPALQAARVNLVDALKDGARGGQGGQRHRLRSVLVAGELALALVLLIAAGLLMRSFTRLQAVEPGFDPVGAATLTVSFPAKRFPTPEDRAAFVDRALQRLRAVPGVANAGAVHILPLSGGEETYSFVKHGTPPPQPGTEPATQYFVASDGYFEAMRIPLIRGRTFTAHDRAGATRVAIINQAFAARHFPGEDPVGKRIMLHNGPDAWREIIGVVRDVKLDRLDETAEPQCYEPIAQMGPRSATFVIRADPTMAALLRAEMRALDPDQPVSEVRPLTSFVTAASARQRFAMTLFAVFSGLALVLAAVGVYGVMAYSVAQRTGEFGIRMALGAQPADLLGLVMRRAATLIAIGLALGLAGAFAATRLLESMLFGVGAHDPLTFGAIAGLLAAVALAACLVPARRATKVDPMVALRAE